MQARLAYERKVTEICLLSGVHPGFTLDTFIDLITGSTKPRPVSISMPSARTKSPMLRKEGPYPTRTLLLGSKRRGSGPSRGPQRRSSWIPSGRSSAPKRSPLPTGSGSSKKPTVPASGQRRPSCTDRTRPPATRPSTSVSCGRSRTRRTGSPNSSPSRMSIPTPPFTSRGLPARGLPAARTS